MKNKKKIQKRFFIGLFGLSWKVCSDKERKSFIYSDGPEVPSVLSGAFGSFESAKADCAERNKDLFV